MRIVRSFETYFEDTSCIVTGHCWPSSSMLSLQVSNHLLDGAAMPKRFMKASCFVWTMPKSSIGARQKYSLSRVDYSSSQHVGSQTKGNEACRAGRQAPLQCCKVHSVDNFSFIRKIISWFVIINLEPASIESACTTWRNMVIKSRVISELSWACRRDLDISRHQDDVSFRTSDSASV
jgi:hypothetical protein